MRNTSFALVYLLGGDRSIEGEGDGVLLIGLAKEIVLRLSTSLEEQTETSMMLGVWRRKSREEKNLPVAASRLPESMHEAAHPP